MPTLNVTDCKFDSFFVGVPATAGTLFGKERRGYSSSGLFKTWMSSCLCFAQAIRTLTLRCSQTQRSFRDGPTEAFKPQRRTTSKSVALSASLLQQIIAMGSRKESIVHGFLSLRHGLTYACDHISEWVM